MTLADIAKKYGISIQRVYKKLADSGINVKTLKDNKTGEITPDGEAVINQLFNTRVKKFNQAETAIVTRLQASVEKLENENSILKGRISDLQSQIEILKTALDSSNTALQQANELNKTLASRIPDRHRGIFGYLTGRTKKEK